MAKVGHRLRARVAERTQRRSEHRIVADPVDQRRPPGPFLHDRSDEAEGAEEQDEPEGNVNDRMVEHVGRFSTWSGAVGYRWTQWIVASRATL